MKIGLSSYSFRPLLAAGTLQIESMFDWLADHAAEHVEIATFSFARPGTEAEHELVDETEILQRLEDSSTRSDVPVSGFCMGASFIQKTPDQRQAEIERVKRYVDLCVRFGAGFLRHDVVPWSYRLTGPEELEREMPGIVDACRQIAEYGATRGVVTSVEDHGFFMNSAERVLRLHTAVDHPNFKLTVDVGNFLCVDDNPDVSTRRTLPHAAFVHAKDFYVRQTEPGPGWLKTTGGQFIRGSVFGYGDLDARGLIESVVASGYDGYLSLEYEGNEPTLFGCEVGLNNVRSMVAAVKG